MQILLDCNKQMGSETKLDNQSCVRSSTAKHARAESDRRWLAIEEWQGPGEGGGGVA